MLIRYEAPSGDILEIEPARFQPLSYSDLVDDYNKKDKLYPLRIEAKFVTSSRTGFKTKSPASVSMPTNFREPVSIFSLVDGGWLPPPLVIPANFLVDRNVVASFVKMKQRANQGSTTQNDWWAQLFSKFAALINPCLYAFEGKNRKPPSFEEFCRTFELVSAEVRTHLPSARLIEYEPVHFKAAYEIITDVSDRLERETEFLLQTVPLIIHPVVDSRLEKISFEILERARKLKVKTDSLVTVAVLSCLYQRSDGSGFLAARRLVKPKKGYLQPDAYNALSDLRAIEMFTSGLGFQRERFALCTCDRAMAAFWSGLNVRFARWHNERPTFSITLTEDLFPRLDKAARKKLASELGS
jgi:hypothetical protein